MAKIPEAQNRLFKNIFICKECKTKMKSDSQRILKGRVKCRKCGRSAFRPIRKK
ncbi:MAG TPA: 50S ribosomal protein L40e [Candidatus Nanoarchaeia archaeon]|nr:50S ribosomal protein L40e [Candidatus Nanoarchaeia archaeon]